jgi:hypothetical protein
MRIFLVATNFYLLGLGLTVGLVIYPSFRCVGATQWQEFHTAHQRRIAWAVGPGWVAQASGVLWWLGSHHRVVPGSIHATFALAGVVLTIVAAIPLHRRLAQRFDDREVARLIRWHWWRVACWAICAGVALLA